MVKVVTFLKRKAGMSVEDFQRYWRTRHPEVVVRLPGVRRYVQSHTLASAYRKGEPVYDGIAEVWAEDTEALRTMTRSPENAKVQADEAQFIDRATMGFLVTEEHVVVEGAVTPEAVKAVEFLSRKAGASVDEFQRHCRESHAKILAGIPGLRRCVLSATRRSAYEAGRVPAHDGVTSMWFASPDALRSAASSPEYGAAVADRERFLAPGQPPFIVTREHVIVGGPSSESAG
ncbi:MAG TPA: EthD domain-containing protein [Methylomirabilota bacterium]